MKKSARWATAGGIVVLVGVLALTVGASDEEEHGQYISASVTRVDLNAVVTATGTLQPLVRVDVGSQLSGQIADLFVDFNDTVQRDQPMARLDAVPYEARVREAGAALKSARTDADIRRAMIGKAKSALTSVRARRAVLEARLAASQAGYDQAQRDLVRRQRLYEARTIAVGELENSRASSDTAAASLSEAQAQLVAHEAEVSEGEAALRVAEAELASAEAAVEQQQALLEQAQFELARTTIRAPISGVVIGRNVDRGQTVAASLEAPTLFTLAQDLRRMTVHTKVDEASIGSMRVGQFATFKVDAYPDREFAGKVVQIRQAPEVNQSVVTYPVLIEVENADRALLPGMTATVRVIVAEEKNALAVPSAAFRFRPAGVSGRDLGPADVWVLDNTGAPAPIEVATTGLADDQWTGIAPGRLEEGDEVLVGSDDAGPPSGVGIRFGL